MNSQSLNTISRKSYHRKAEDILLQMSDNYFYEKHYKIGAGIDRDKVSFYLQNYRFLDTDNCELNNYINSKIIGVLDDLDTSEVTPINRLQIQKPNCNITEIISQNCGWENASW